MNFLMRIPNVGICDKEKQAIRAITRQKIAAIQTEVGLKNAKGTETFVSGTEALPSGFETIYITNTPNVVFKSFYNMGGCDPNDILFGTTITYQSPNQQVSIEFSEDEAGEDNVFVSTETRTLNGQTETTKTIYTVNSNGTVTAAEVRTNTSGTSAEKTYLVSGVKV